MRARLPLRTLTSRRTKAPTESKRTTINTGTQVPVTIFGRKTNMAMQGIDIASYQAGIDIASLPIDFVIVKSTQGTCYVNPDFTRAANQTLSCGKKLGVYHYIGGQGAQGEMKHFADKFAPYKGKAIPCLDWESIQNSAWQDESYLEKCIKEFIALTGIPPMIYASLSAFPWGLCSKYNCGTWVAQYASMNETGIQNNPWNEGAYSCAIRQYTSGLKLNGWGGRLDGNKAYFDAAAWDKFAHAEAVSPSAPSTNGDKSVSQLADEVIAGKWGNGSDRVNKLTAAGYDAAAIQAEVNSRYSEKTISQLADEVLEGKHGNGEERKASLGSKYDEVQKEVNRRLGVNDIDDLARRTINGEFGNGNTRRQKLGALYDRVQKRVNELLK